MLLRKALGLWRGPPLADLSFEPFAQAEIVRLEEQRLAALEAARPGRARRRPSPSLVGELRQLVTEHPTREPFARQLMLALYRAGRQTEALEVFRALAPASWASSASSPEASCASSTRRCSPTIHASTRCVRRRRSMPAIVAADVRKAGAVTTEPHDRTRG